MRTLKQSFVILTPIGEIEAMPLSLEAAGRTCYKSEGRVTSDSAEKFVRMIIKRGHDSVLEHQTISVRVICDRGISHEIVRHRIGVAYSQESTRYCDYGGKGIQIIHPEGLTEAQIMRRTKLFWHTQEVYDVERAEGVSPQIARGVLPTCLKTEIVMTLNLRAWRHFFELRCASAAHPQIREIALPLLKVFSVYLPSVFEDLDATLNGNG